MIPLGTNEVQTADFNESPSRDRNGSHEYRDCPFALCQRSYSAGNNDEFDDFDQHRFVPPWPQSPRMLEDNLLIEKTFLSGWQLSRPVVKEPIDGCSILGVM